MATRHLSVRSTTGSTSALSDTSRPKALRRTWDWLTEACTLFYIKEDSVQGNVRLQMILLYALMVVIVGSTELLDWASDFRFATLVPLIFAAYLAIDVANIIRAIRGDHSTGQMFVHLVPLAILIVIAREARVICALVFFCGSMAIFIQIGQRERDIRRELVAYSAGYVLVYAGCAVFMSQFYTDETGVNPRRGRVLARRIAVGEEVVVCFSILLLTYIYCLLDRYVRLYAKHMTHHTQRIRTLQKQLDQAKQQQQAQEQQQTARHMQVDTPLERILSLLLDVQRVTDDDDLADKLEHAMQLLASGTLYQPEIRGSLTDLEWVREATNMNDGKTPGPTANFFEMPLETGKVLELAALEALVQSLGGTATPGARPFPNTFVALLDNLDSWSFDVLSLAERSAGHPLIFVAMGLMHRHDLFRLMGVDEHVMLRFVGEIEAGYVASNTYHNATHAADVTQTFNTLIVASQLAEVMTPLEKFASLIACLVHDFAHPGVSNNFLIAVESPLAIRYNDRSVLESHHCAAAFAIMRKDGNNILRNLSRDQRVDVRRIVLSLILATDMGRHFELVSKFTAKLSASAPGAPPFVVTDPADRMSLIEMIVKCADVSNPAKPSYLAVAWAKAITEEFFAQGDRERDLGMKVAAFMDRTAPGAADLGKAQTNFIDFITPMYGALVDALPRLGFARVQMQSNRAMWAQYPVGGAGLNVRPAATPKP